MFVISVMTETDIVVSVVLSNRESSVLGNAQSREGVESREANPGKKWCTAFRPLTMGTGEKVLPAVWMLESKIGTLVYTARQSLEIYDGALRLQIRVDNMRVIKSHGESNSGCSMSDRQLHRGRCLA